MELRENLFRASENRNLTPEEMKAVRSDQPEDGNESGTHKCPDGKILECPAGYAFTKYVDVTQDGVTKKGIMCKISSGTLPPTPPPDPNPNPNPNPNPTDLSSIEKGSGNVSEIQERVTMILYCDDPEPTPGAGSGSGSGSGSGTTNYPNRKEACVGKKYGDNCTWYTDDLQPQTGRCYYDVSHLIQPGDLFCSKFNPAQEPNQHTDKL